MREEGCIGAEQTIFNPPSQATLLDAAAPHVEDERRLWVAQAKQEAELRSPEKDESELSPSKEAVGFDQQAELDLAERRPLPIGHFDAIELLARQTLIGTEIGDSVAIRKVSFLSRLALGNIQRPSAIP
jgi:hypothetical protein